MPIHYSKIRKMKLIYFNARGRAELARLILAQGGEAYDDERIEGADWPKLKPSKPILMTLIQCQVMMFALLKKLEVVCRITHIFY